MKSTGIVRKVDELGRVVLPKELRKTYGYTDKQPVEILADDDCIIIKKYDTTDNAVKLAEELEVAVHKTGCSGRAASLASLLLSEVKDD